MPLGISKTTIPYLWACKYTFSYSPARPVHPSRPNRGRGAQPGPQGLWYHHGRTHRAPGKNLRPSAARCRRSSLGTPWRHKPATHNYPKPHGTPSPSLPSTGARPHYHLTPPRTGPETCPHHDSPQPPINHAAPGPGLNPGASACNRPARRCTYEDAAPRAPTHGTTIAGTNTGPATPSCSLSPPMGGF